MSSLRNIDVTPKGELRPRKGYKTFAGMVRELWHINKRYTKFGIVGDFNVRLPLKTGGFKFYKAERLQSEVRSRAKTKAPRKLAK